MRCTRMGDYFAAGEQPPDDADGRLFRSRLKAPLTTINIDVGGAGPAEGTIVTEQMGDYFADTGSPARLDMDAQGAASRDYRSG